jgi:FKBP-type peptidyl-prolyl cis-trans isomerase
MSKLVLEELRVGDGVSVAQGTRVEIAYVARHEGKLVGSSTEDGQPLSFEIGATEVIEGLEQAVLGMRLGGKRRVTIPPELGYGSRGVEGRIPVDATLVFDIELLRAQ